MEYLGARGTLIHEKNLKSKISCQTAFKLVKYKDDVSCTPPRFSLAGMNIMMGIEMRA